MFMCHKSSDLIVFIFGTDDRGLGVVLHKNFILGCAKETDPYISPGFLIHLGWISICYAGKKEKT